MTVPKASSEIALALTRQGNTFLFRRLRKASFIGVKYDYVFIGSPKSGVTSAKAALWHIEELGDRPGNVFLHERKDVFRRPSAATIPLPEALERLNSPKHFRFTCWRDPIDRLVSAYRDKISNSRPPDKKTLADRAVIARHLNRQSESEISFNEFVDFACAQPDGERNVHWMSQHRVALHDYVDYHRIVRLEKFADDMSVVFDIMGVPTSQRPDLRPHYNGSSGPRPVVDASTANRIREAYSLDYSLVS
jgi:hypothetical protein